MPRSIREILEKADEFADRFESHDPQPNAVVDATTLRRLREAYKERASAEHRLADAVAVARTDGQSWSAIGTMLGVSGETARQKYGRPAHTR